jgi:hypothetical protein
MHPPAHHGALMCPCVGWSAAQPADLLHAADTSFVRARTQLAALAAAPAAENDAVHSDAQFKQARPHPPTQTRLYQPFPPRPDATKTRT